MKLLPALLNWSTVILFAVLLALFGIWSPKFFTAGNLENILVQSSSTAVVAIGMTFVLLTAGVDLSVGSVMFIAAAVAGKLMVSGVALPVALLGMIATGLVCGSVNALLVTRLGIIAFIATIGTLYAGRGFGLWLTETRAMNLPDSFLQIGSMRLGGVALPLVVFALVLALAHLTLAHTPFGRQLYAVGNNLEAARKAGLNRAGCEHRFTSLADSAQPLAVSFRFRNSARCRQRSARIANFPRLRLRSLVARVFSEGAARFFRARCSGQC
jgi:ribose transport system permease protein